MDSGERGKMPNHIADEMRILPVLPMDGQGHVLGKDKAYFAHSSGRNANQDSGLLMTC